MSIVGAITGAVVLLVRCIPCIPRRVIVLTAGAVCALILWCIRAKKTVA